MNITSIGSTIKEIIFTRFRVLRVDDDGRLEVVNPVGSPNDVNVAEVGGTATEHGGIAGLLGVGINRVGTALLAATGLAGTFPIAGTSAHDAAAGTERPILTGTEVALVEQAAMTAGDRSKDFSDQYGNRKVVDRAHDYGIQANRMAEVAPVNMRFDPIFFSRPNITAAGWVYDYFAMDGAVSFALQIIAAITGGDVLQMTIGVTMQDDGTVPASCTYKNVTDLFAAGAPFITNAHFAADNQHVAQANLPVGVKYIRIGYYVTGGNTTDVTVHGKRWY